MPVVLLVDDQPFVNAVLTKLTAGESDIQLHYCANAREAHAMVRAIRPSVILQDLMMGEVNGFDLLRDYRSDPDTSAIPVVMLSGNDDADSRRRALDLGAADYLVKMPAKADLLTCLRHHIASRAEPPVP